MAEKSVYINFGADTGKLEADLARGNAAIRATAREMQRVAAEMQKTGAAADSDLGRKLTTLGEKLSAAKTATTAARDELSRLVEASAKSGRVAEESARAHGLNAAQMAESVHVAKALADEIAAGQNPLRAVLIEGGRIAQIAQGLSLMTLGWGAVAASILSAAAAAAYFFMQSQKARETSQQLQASSAFGGLGLAPGQADAITRQLAQISGLSWDSAQALVAAFGLMQTKSAEVFRAIATDIDGFAKALGKTPEDAGKTLIGLFDNSKLSADELHAAIGGLSEAQREQYERALAMANPLERQAALQAILAQKIAATRQETIHALQADLDAAQAHRARDEAALASAGDEATGFAREAVEGEIAALQKQVASLRAANEEAARLPQIIRDSTSAADLLRAKFDEVLESVSGVGAAVKTASSIDTLRAGLQGATGDAASLIRQFEGFQEAAKWDKNHFRAGFGSDTTTSATGVVSEVKQDTIVSREDAERDLARRIADVHADLEKRLGASWTALSDKAKASLTSIAYNYGSLPESVAAAARGGDEKRIADAIAARAGDNGGINAGRREREALNVTADYALIQDPSKRAQARDAIGDLADQQRRRDDEKNGGGPVDRAELANIEAEAAGRADSVAQQQRLVASREQELALAQGVGAKSEAERALAEARVELRNRENAATESGLRLDAERLKNGQNVEGAKAAELKLADFRIAQAGADVAARNAAIGEKEAIEQRYEDQARALSIQTAQQRIADAREETQARLRELDLQLKAHEITESQKIALTQAAYAREKSVTLEAYQSELQLADLTLRDRQRIQHEIEASEREFAQRTRQTQLEAADATQRGWNDATKQISSAFDGQIGGLLKGTTTWAQASRNVLSGFTEDIVKFFVNWGVQDAANFAKHAAINAGWLASDTATQAAATSAHVAGAAAQKAVDASTVQGDAARAAAGAYAAVAGVPLIGPVLAPAAAAAAYASTMAFSAFDIGAWSIPHDQLAMVHHNELIMPAAEAGAFRSLLSDRKNDGEQGSSGARAVTLAPQTHFHVTAMDASGVAGALRGNQAAMMKVINQAVRDGAHLGLSRLR